MERKINKEVLEALEQGLTTKSDLAQERYQDLKEYFGDKETAKTILEDRKEFKAWLERLRWHVKRADELARELEQLKGTSNLGVDCISRQAVLDLIADYDLSMGQVVRGIHALPSVTPQPRKGHWITHHPLDYFQNDTYMCSECGKIFYDKRDECPVCGAKMDKEGMDDK